MLKVFLLIKTLIITSIFCRLKISANGNNEVIVLKSEDENENQFNQVDKIESNYLKSFNYFILIRL